MARDIHRDARKRQNELAREAAEQFDNTLLHNRVYEQVQGQLTRDDPLGQVLDAAERAYDLAEHHHIDDDTGMEIFGAAEDLNDTVDELVEDHVARACADVIVDGDAWTDAWDMADIHAAQAEAREWIGDHLDAAERVGVLEAVKKAEVPEVPADD